MNHLIIRLIYSALASDDIRVLIVSLLKNHSKDTGLKAFLDSENVSEEELDQPYSTFNPNIAKKLWLFSLYVLFLNLIT
ncbi:hypothetical protein SHM_13320 [Spiroplasma ixodetis]|uniref:Uncharacterized protein n=1 Tax=Spiroplasma ixodetis TaxID=2141 RepID=A0ABM8BUY6_9MOLU|nr:hypothetical protein SHM_13320 [Spiroplasma ixodetis]